MKEYAKIAIEITGENIGATINQITYGITPRIVAGPKRLMIKFFLGTGSSI